MRLIFFLAIFYSVPALSQSSIYELDIQTITGETVSFKAYKGQKILIASVSTDNLQKKGALVFWDSLKAANPKTAMILMAAGDMGTAVDSAALNNIKNNTSDKLVLSGTVQVKKDKGNNQNPVMQWLTDGNKNSHFNADVETDQQIYVISESGVLYAVLGKGVSPSVIDQVLKQNDVKPQIYSGLKQ